LPRKTNSHEHHFIKNCHSNCSFSTVDENQNACLGVYYNSSGNILIKQLGKIHPDDQCLTSKQCILDVDSLNSQSFSCCCSSDNCTLNWKILSITTTTIIPSRSMTTMKNILIIEQNDFLWKLFLIIFILMMIIILIMFTFGLWKSLRNKHEKKNKKSFIKSSSSSIEQLFYSAQQIIIGKNSILYKAIFDNELIAMKVYKQTNILIWKNEVTLLKSIKHESIIKYVKILNKTFFSIDILLSRLLSDGQYNAHLYLILPYYENSTLQAYLRTPNRTLSINQCLIYFRSLASAISYLHLGRNNTHMTIVHRDIKSSNILICKDEFQLCLADFGAAAALPQVLTEKDFVQIGTMRYMAPELLEGVIAHTREALCSVDMYALALVMWEIITQCDVYPLTSIIQKIRS
jgi:tRNA A-37 threonylcarbamoyl transferase component Bud32